MEIVWATCIASMGYAAFELWLLQGSAAWVPFLFATALLVSINTWPLTFFGGKLLRTLSSAWYILIISVVEYPCYSVVCSFGCHLYSVLYASPPLWSDDDAHHLVDLVSDNVCLPPVSAECSRKRRRPSQIISQQGYWRQEGGYGAL